MRNGILIIVVLLLAACSSHSNTGNTDEPQTAMEGKEVYKLYCVACHGADGKLAFSGAKDLSVSTLDLETRTLQIKNGKGVMNAFKGILTDEEIENVAVYIEELRVK